MKPMEQPYHETLIYAAYYAPRGRQRLYLLAGQLAQHYLLPEDLLIAVIGAEGAGKSTLIKGLFPGLELTNDDDGVNVRSAPLHAFSPDDYFSGHTFHIDAHYELAFRQKHEIAESVKTALAHGRRVVVEHFDLLYSAMGCNAQIIFGIGEEVIVARPSVFGPLPYNIKNVVDKTIKYRRMAHTAEDITWMALAHDYKIAQPVYHSDIKHGFVIKFKDKPAIDPADLEAKVKAIIARNLPIAPEGENKLSIGGRVIDCTGTRTHVRRSGDIQDFRMLKEYKYDFITQEYLLVGMVGGKEIAGFEEINESGL